MVAPLQTGAESDMLKPKFCGGGIVMRNLFHPDSKFMQAISTLGDYILLNFLFLLFCVPVVTIGAAKTAMYRVMFEMLEENGSLYKRFVKTFFRDFVPSTLVFLLKYAVVAVLGLLIYLTAANRLPLRTLVLVAQLLFLLLWVMIFANIPAQISRFRSTFGQYLKNGVYITLTHPIKSFLTAIMDMLFVVLLLQPDILVLFAPVWMFLYFSVTGNLCARIWCKPFAFYISKAMGEAEAPEAETEEI